nr:immunoglobulin light chain junction region [Macaca mulatta]MOX74213.1 immunoglobulin light chain junction region [Macaca mulatta]MOX75117.1 immunoglobulin light chain junction region [Macaca mulatta]MOX76917.1 immunoglobulin light chain junction region [Macaca mulatta]MOX77176.1 immunoglobulin light chain junction region [Macaca mulatta]
DYYCQTTDSNTVLF